VYKPDSASHDVAVRIGSDPPAETQKRVGNPTRFPYSALGEATSGHRNLARGIDVRVFLVKDQEKSKSSPARWTSQRYSPGTSVVLITSKKS
jgi:hypothetical protein